MRHKQLFELSILHDYYQSRICPDFSIEPTTECSKILKGHRLIVKNKVNGIVVIAPVDSKQIPWIKLADNLQLTFILKLKNTDFIDFTDIDWEPINNNIYQFSNKFSNNEENTQIGPPELVINKPELSEQKLSRGQNIFGIVNIYNNDSMPKSLDQESEYTITLKAKEHHWRYYLVSDSVTNGNEFLIEDQDPTRDPKIKFTKTEKTDPVLSALNQQFPQSQQYLFESESEIACQEESRKNIQLLIKQSQKKGESTTLIEHLPNPPNRNGIKVINIQSYL